MPQVTHPGALEYVRLVIRTAVHIWGFQYLKLDFLHTAAMPGGARHVPSMSRASALHQLMAAVREEAGEAVFILACGAPLGPCIGHVDALRVSADAATHWLPTGIDVPGIRWLFASDRTNLPAARNMVRNVAVRLPMGGRLWRNDPDCLILREAGVDFSLGQAQALASVAALAAGALIFSDPPTDLASSRLAVLQRVLPPLPRAGVALDLLRREIPAQMVVPLSPADRDPAANSTIGWWWLVGLFNWSAEDSRAGGDGEDGISTRTLLAAAAAAPHGNSGVPPPTPTDGGARGWHVFDIWSGTYQRLDGPWPTLHPPAVPPRCGWLAAIRPVGDGDEAQLVGTDVHISCGLEIEWLRDAPAGSGGRELELRINTGRAVEAPHVWLYLPCTAQATTPQVTAEGGVHGEPLTLPAPVWVERGVWMLTLASIDRGGVSPIHRVHFETS